MAPSRRTSALGLALVVGIAAVGIGLMTSTPVPSSASVESPAPSPNIWLAPDGLARAKAFRTPAGLRVDDAWLRFVANDPSALANVTAVSIPMTDVEVADFQRRNASTAELTIVLGQFGAAHPDTWAGYYVDSGAFVVMLVDPSGRSEAALRKLVVPSAPLIFKSATRTFQELDDLQTRITNDGWLLTNYHVLEAGVDVKRNVVDLEISSSDDRAPAAIEAHYGAGDALSVRIDGTGVATLPTGAIGGRAVDEAGRPAAGLSIELVSDIPGVDLGEVAMQTRDDGSFLLEDVPAAGYRLRLVTGPDTVRTPPPAIGIEVGSARLEVKADQTTRVNVTVIWP